MVRSTYIIIATFHIFIYLFQLGNNSKKFSLKCMDSLCYLYVLLMHLSVHFAVATVIVQLPSHV